MTSTGEMRRLGRRPALDGLRGVAILPVLADHAGFLPGPTGQIGVALFFTLSGFLITRLIVERVDAGTWSYREFLTARVVRLAPALIVVVAGVSAVLLAQGRDAVAAAWPALTYTRNIWGAVGVPDPTAHTWSLAVEEQFYLLWPLLLLGGIRFRAMLLPAVLTAAAVSFGLHLFVSAHGLQGGNWLPMQASGLLIGCALALTPPPVEPLRLLAAASWLGLIGLTVTLVAWPVPAITGAMAANVVAAGLILSSSHGSRALEYAPLRDLGRISYAVYLWHFPLLVLTGTLHARMGSLPILAVSVAAAVASTLLLEEPLRRQWRRRSACLVGAVELLQQHPDHAVVLPGERLDLSGDLRVRR